MIDYNYWGENINPMQLYYCIESKKSGNEWLSGQRINCFQCAATFTAFRYYDAGDYNGNGKLVTRHFFDNWGRTVNVLTMNPEVTDVLGVSLGAYTKNEANSRRNNRLTNAASAGIQSINLLQNADMEYL